MSVSACRSCGEPITFVLRADGRWRPVDVTYTVLELEGDEMACVQSQGTWSVTDVKEVRVYRAHACPENPAWNRGRAKTRTVAEPTVDLTTGVVAQEPEPAPATEPLWRQREKESAARRTGERLLGVECPGCGAPVGDPCKNEFDAWLMAPCRARRLAAAFTDDQPWPPKPNQGGYRQMRDWLREHHSLFANPKETP